MDFPMNNEEKIAQIKKFTEAMQKNVVGMADDRSAWTNAQWFNHLGAWENDNGNLVFGSSFAFGILLEQFRREQARQWVEVINDFIKDPEIEE